MVFCSTGLRFLQKQHHVGTGKEPSPACDDKKNLATGVVDETKEVSIFDETDTVHEQTRRRVHQGEELKIGDHIAVYGKNDNLYKHQAIVTKFRGKEKNICYGACDGF